MNTGLSETQLEQMRSVFREQPALERVVLFGSRAKGNHRPGSDVDLCLVGETLGHREFVRIAAGLEALDFPVRIDTVLFHQISHPNLLDHIARVGLPVYEASLPRSASCPGVNGAESAKWPGSRI